ncbi:hypothetical protein C5167_024927 [Papaver somniferum]|uniref:Tubby C-terminal domain-containing protein n=1 Tax=Papaver somniferum TaxID=3469 RepID=A0A4Y7JT04_PAPSO|nr:hypothetical protein C5167_024927 [Papaver somniferum]
MALTSSSVAVISPQYCTPYRVDLYTARKVEYITEGNYLGAFDINGNTIFKVTTKYSKRHRILVDAAGVPVVSLKPKKFFGRWNAYRGDSTNSKDLLFIVKSSNFIKKIFQFDTYLDVFLASNTSEGVCDFKIKQTCNEISCLIYRGNSDNLIAETLKKKSVQRKDIVSVTVYPNVDYAFVIALHVVLDGINARGGMFRVGGRGDASKSKTPWSHFSWPQSTNLAKPKPREMAPHYGNTFSTYDPEMAKPVPRYDTSLSDLSIYHGNEAD